METPCQNPDTSQETLLALKKNPWDLCFQIHQVAGDCICQKNLKIIYLIFIKIAELVNEIIHIYECRTHDDVIKWKHFPHYWPFVRGIYRSTVNSPHKGQRRGALIFSLICAWIHSWVNNREDGDLRRHRAHYYVDVMWWCRWWWLVRLPTWNHNRQNNYVSIDTGYNKWMNEIRQGSKWLNCEYILQSDISSRE